MGNGTARGMFPVDGFHACTFSGIGFRDIGFRSKLKP